MKTTNQNLLKIVMNTSEAVRYCSAKIKKKKIFKKYSVSGCGSLFYHFVFKISVLYVKKSRNFSRIDEHKIHAHAQQQVFGAASYN